MASPYLPHGQYPLQLGTSAAGAKIDLSHSVSPASGPLYMAVTVAADDSAQVLVYNKLDRRPVSSFIPPIPYPEPGYTLLTLASAGSRVRDIKVGPDKRVYVIGGVEGSGTLTVHVFDELGTPLFTFPVTTNEITFPRLFINDENTKVYVSGSGSPEGGPTGQKCLKSFSTVDGTAGATWQVSTTLAILDFVVKGTTLYWLGPGSVAYDPVNPDDPTLAGGIHRHNLDSNTSLTDLVTDVPFFEHAQLLQWTDVDNGDGGHLLVGGPFSYTTPNRRYTTAGVLAGAINQGGNSVWVDGTTVWFYSSVNLNGPIHRVTIDDAGEVVAQTFTYFASSPYDKVTTALCVSPFVDATPPNWAPVGMICFITPNRATNCGQTPPPPLVGGPRWLLQRFDLKPRGEETA